MPQPRIALTLEGMQGPQRHVRVNDFLREIQLLLSSLREAERHVYPAGGSNLYYHVVELSHSSPATVVLEPQIFSPGIDLRQQVLSTLLSVVRQIDSTGELSERVSHALLEDLAGMATPVGKTLSTVTIAGDGEAFLLTKDFQRKVEQLLGPEETYPGAVRGMLEAINLHREANVFRVYPDVGPSKVTCHFPVELESSAINAIGRFVEVRGTLKYKVAAPYPHEVKVESIEALPDESELPTLNELRGVAPNATGLLSSEEFVRGLRDAAD